MRGNIVNERLWDTFVNSTNGCRPTAVKDWPSCSLIVRPALGHCWALEILSLSFSLSLSLSLSASVTFTFVLTQANSREPLSLSLSVHGIPFSSPAAALFPRSLSLFLASLFAKVESSLSLLFLSLYSVLNVPFTHTQNRILPRWRICRLWRWYRGRRRRWPEQKEAKKARNISKSSHKYHASLVVPTFDG